MPDHPVIPNIFANGPGNTADANLVNANYEYLRAWLDSRFGGATSAQMWVANASGVATPRTVSGHGTISNTGVLSLIPIVTAMLANKAVTPAKLDLTVITVAQGSPNINITSGGWVDLITATTPPAGDYIVFGTVAILCSLTGEGQNGVNVKFSTDSFARAGQGIFDAAAPANWPFSVDVRAKVTLDGSTSLKLQAQKVVTSASAHLQSMRADIDTSAGGTRLLLLPVG